MTNLKLNSNQQVIFDLLKTAQQPLSAYTILEQARPFGFHAPTQVYRVLNKLIGYGLIIKLNTVNMYFAHETPHAHQQHYHLLTVCTDCTAVQDTCLSDLNQGIQQSLHQQHFVSESPFLELLGQCEQCIHNH